MEFARIKLAGKDIRELEEICKLIKEIAKKWCFLQGAGSASYQEA